MTSLPQSSIEETEVITELHSTTEGTTTLSMATRPTGANGNNKQLPETGEGTSIIVAGLAATIGGLGYILVSGSKKKKGK